MSEPASPYMTGNLLTYKEQKAVDDLHRIADEFNKAWAEMFWDAESTLKVDVSVDQMDIVSDMAAVMPVVRSPRLIIDIVKRINPSTTERT